MENDVQAGERLAAVQRRIGVAAVNSGRSAADVTLVAVTKTFDAPDIAPVLEAGHRVFGENRVQEAKNKWPPLRKRYPDIELHLIGPLQSNKTREAVALFDVIQTVDRLKIAETIAAEIAHQQREPRLFVQVNTGAEPQKAGIGSEDAVAFIEHCRNTLGLTIEGLMCIPPFDESPEPHFKLLANLAGEVGVNSLSMGMSADFEAAIDCGATLVRVGSAIFGGR
ncbi:MAG: YggS family pyridoxal phosphate-dependent enzyme [Alphaproteobacteria bacterium]